MTAADGPSPVDERRLDLLLRRISLMVENGPLPSAQVAVAQHGTLVVSECFGDTTPSMRYVLQSAGRPVLASLIWRLLGDGLLSVDQRVSDVIPEFGTNGKDVVTVEQVLLHTAGFPFAPLGYPKMLNRDQRLEAFARWRLDYAPGTQLQFHLTSAAWILAELIERRTGETAGQFLQSQISDPLDLTLQLGVSEEEQLETVAPMLATDRTSADQQIDPWGPWFLSRPEILAAGEPSHSMVGTAADLALFYQAVAHSGRWDASTVQDATRIRLTAVPAGEQLYGGSSRPVNMGLFVTVSGTTGGNWMPSVGSPATWGHGGAAYQLAFYDPEADLSFACLTNGYPLSGYDYSRAGVGYITNMANLANDVVT